MFQVSIGDGKIFFFVEERATRHITIERVFDNIKVKHNKVAVDISSCKSRLNLFSLSLISKLWYKIGKVAYEAWATVMTALHLPASLLGVKIKILISAQPYLT